MRFINPVYQISSFGRISSLSFSPKFASLNKTSSHMEGDLCMWLLHGLPIILWMGFSHGLPIVPRLFMGIQYVTFCSVYILGGRCAQREDRPLQMGILAHWQSVCVILVPHSVAIVFFNVIKLIRGFRLKVISKSRARRPDQILNFLKIVKETIIRR
jgi:hypothetical protein